MKCECTKSTLTRTQQSTRPHMLQSLLKSSAKILGKGFTRGSVNVSNVFNGCSQNARQKLQNRKCFTESLELLPDPAQRNLPLQVNFIPRGISILLQLFSSSAMLHCSEVCPILPQLKPIFPQEATTPLQEYLS